MGFVSMDATASGLRVQRTQASTSQATILASFRTNLALLVKRLPSLVRSTEPRKFDLISGSSGHFSCFKPKMCRGINWHLRVPM